MSALLDAVIGISLSVCLFICLSVTLWYDFNKKQTYQMVVQRLVFGSIKML